MYTIISPHPDDELIGAFSLIKKGLIDKVVYLDISNASPTNTPPQECDPDYRFNHAKECGKEFNFSVHRMVFGDLFDFLQKNSEDIFLVPDIMDNHILHKAVNCVARLSGCKLGYYSVDMNVGYVKELSKVDQYEKRTALNRYYGVESSSLWENNWKYFLFEGTVLEI